MRKRIFQAGIKGARVVGRYAAFSKGVPVECVVIAVRFIDDERNVSKQFTEYDVKDLRTGQIYNNVRRLDAVAGMDDGDENVLRPAQKLFGAASTLFDPKVAQLSQSDGDRVQVSFNYGSQHTAVITDVLPHPKMTYGTTRLQGMRRFSIHKGTSVETQQDGTYQIKRGNTTITLNPDETIEIAHQSGATMRFTNEGDIVTTPAKERDIIYGKGDENMVLGQQLKTVLENLVDAVLLATYPVSGAVAGPMAPPAATTLTQLKSTLDTILSKMSFTTREV